MIGGRVRAGAAIVVLAGCAAGCSVLFDADSFEGGTSADAAVESDSGGCVPPAPTGALDLDHVRPAEIFEGMGASEFAPPVPIVFIGTNIGADATITASDETITLGEPVVSCEGTMLATTVRIPVDPTLIDGDTRDITFTVSSGDRVEKVDLVVRGLDERTFAAGNVLTEWAGIAPRYSRIVIDGALHANGDIPIRLVATAEIVVDGPFDADGRSTGDPGTAACDGGAAGSPGDCADGGGRPGGESTIASGGGGGGGGGSAPGSEGETSGASAGGLGGAATGTTMLAPLEGVRGNGGGGGGNAMNGDGGNGGGGGGVIELTSFGDLHLNAPVRAAGGDGAPGTGATCATHGGGGGGGSGGAILVRAHGTIFGTETPISAPGGAGGKGGTGCPAGGDGSPGRVRIDNPDATRTALVATPTPVRGPMWAEGTPAIVRSTTPQLAFHGEPSWQYGYRVDDGSGIPAPTDAAGAGSIRPTLSPGLHTICLLVAPTVSLTLEEGANCRTFAVIP